MSGEVVYRPAQKHCCLPPVSDSIGSIPCHPVGTMWRCSCRKVWIVDRPLPVRSGMQRVANEWRRASWLERRRARRHPDGGSTT